MTQGQIVKFAAPMTKAEQTERYRIVELRGDRALVELLCGWAITPTFVYRTADLVAA